MSKIVVTGMTLDEMTEKRPVTIKLRVIITDETLWERVWVYCKRLAKFSHAPVSPKDYQRMKDYLNDHELIDVLLQLVSEYMPTDDYLVNFDVIGHSYIIALLSQSKYRREDILKSLDFLVDYVMDNELRYVVVLHRNVERLKKEYTDLERLEEKLRDFAKRKDEELEETIRKNREAYEERLKKKN